MGVIALSFCRLRSPPEHLPSKAIAKLDDNKESRADFISTMADLHQACREYLATDEAVDRFTEVSEDRGV